MLQQFLIVYWAFLRYVNDWQFSCHSSDQSEVKPQQFTTFFYYNFLASIFKWRPPEFASVLIGFLFILLFVAISESFVFVFGSEAPTGWRVNRL